MEEILHAHIAVHKGADNNAIEHGNSGSFSRGEQAGINAAQNDDGHQQRPDTVFERLSNLLAADMLTAGVTPLFGDQVVDYNDHYRHQQTGSYAADEHFTDGSIGQSAVHNHGVAGGDDQTDGTGGGNHSSGKGFIVAPLFHLRHHNSADSGSSSGGGTGDRAKEGGGQRCHVSKAAGHPAHQRCGHIGQALGNAAAGHHVTGKHEEGNCQQGEGVDGAERFLHQIDNGDCACGHNRCKRGDGKSEGDRHTDTSILLYWARTMSRFTAVCWVWMRASWQN